MVKTEDAEVELIVPQLCTSEVLSPMTSLLLAAVRFRLVLPKFWFPAMVQVPVHPDDCVIEVP